MASYWSQCRASGAPGVLWLDPDVAADPDDLDAMAEAIAASPEDMHTGLVKLWPESTQLPHWIWSHRTGTLGQPATTQEIPPVVSYIALGFLYTPARVLDLVFPKMAYAQWDQVDVALSEAALEAGIPARTVIGCRPKHLHFTKEHDGQFIYRSAVRNPRSL